MKRRVWQLRQADTRIARADSFRNVGQVLEAAGSNGAERYMLTGDRPGGDLEGWRGWRDDRWLPDGWQPAGSGHYLHPNRPVLHYSHDDGRTVTIMRTVTWLGDDDHTPDQARRGLRVAMAALRSAWRDDDLPLAATPATLGRHLWATSIPWDADVPTLDPETQQLIRDTAGQGRWELMRPPVDLEPGGLVGWDMRLAYGGLCRHLPDPATTRVHDSTGWEHRRWWRDGGGMRYQRGRFEVVWTVPDGWDRVGILPRRVDSHDDCRACRSVSDGSWCWPSRPGTYRGWVDGAELAVAADHGWTWTVERAITWDEGRPLDRWAERMVDAYQRADAAADPTDARLARAAVRMTLLQAVGAWWGAGHKRTGTGDPPADADRVTIRGGETVWTRIEPPAWPDAAHPEWSAAIWARCRARMASHRGRGLLHVDRGDVAAVRQDAMYLAGRVRRDWPDDGRVGTLRRSGRWPQAPWPTSVDQLLTTTGQRDE